MRARFALTLICALVLGLHTAPAGAQAPVPDPGSPGAQVGTADYGIRLARPRAAVLSVFHSGAESFLQLRATTSDRPIELEQAPDAIRLWADYEALFMPLIAGWCRFKLQAWRVTENARAPLAEDAVEVVDFGPSRHSGRLVLRLLLKPGLHHIVLAATTESRAVGVPEWTTDRDTADLWILIPPHSAIARPTPGPRPLPLEDGSAPVGGGSDLASAVVQGLALFGDSDTDPAMPLGGLGVGSQRGVAATRAGGAINFAVGHNRVILAHTGEPVRIWSDYELWWTEDATATAAAALSVRHGATDAADSPELASDVFALEDATGPRLADGSLVATLKFENPGSYPLRATLRTVVRMGEKTYHDEDSVPFTVRVLGEPPLVGAIAGRVYGENGDALEGVSVEATDASGSAVGHARTNARGGYVIEKLPPGEYLVHAAPAPLNYLDEWWQDRPTMHGAEPVNVVAGATTGGIDFGLTPGGSITGRVLDVAGDGIPGIEITVGFLRRDTPAPEPVPEDLGLEPGTAFIARTRTNAEGYYGLDRLPANAYWVRARDLEGRYLTEYYDDKPDFAHADKVWVTAGQVPRGIDFVLEQIPHRTLVFVDPAHQAVVIGNRGKLHIAAAGVENLGAFETELRWDADLLQVEEVLLGGFLGSTGRKVIPVEPVIDNVAGRLRFAAASIGDEPGPSGRGVLFAVVFATTNQGETAVEVSESILTEPSGKSIAHDVRHGKVSIVECMFGDFDCNCVIDIRDVMAVVLRWGTSEGDPEYDPLYDLDGDGDIDIIDVQIEASLWGKRCDDPTPQPHPGLDAGQRARGPADVSRLSLAGATTLTLTAEPSAAGIGQLVAVTLSIAGADDLAGFDFWLAYDQDRLRFVDARLDDFLGSSGRNVYPLGPTLGDGQVAVGAFTLPGVPAASGAGNLATLEFEVLAGGPSQIEVTEATTVNSQAESSAIDCPAITVQGRGGNPVSYVPFAACHR